MGVEGVGLEGDGVGVDVVAEGDVVGEDLVFVLVACGEDDVVAVGGELVGECARDGGCGAEDEGVLVCGGVSGHWCVPV